MNDILILDRVWEHFHSLVGAVGRNQNAAFQGLFSEICVAMQPGLLLEVGAHEAAFSRRMADLLPEAIFLAYEANPFVFERYRSEMPAAITYLNQAVGADTSNKTFYIPNEIPTRNGTLTLAPTNTTSSLRERTQSGVANNEVTVECTTIDEIIRVSKASGPAVLWVDVEGAVGDVLFGAHRALQDGIAAILVEVETQAAWQGQWLVADVADYLACRGFALLARDCETSWQYNCIFLKESLMSDTIWALVQGYMTALHAKPGPGASG